MTATATSVLSARDGDGAGQDHRGEPGRPIRVSAAGATIAGPTSQPAAKERSRASAEQYAYDRVSRLAGIDTASPGTTPKRAPWASLTTLDGRGRTMSTTAG